MKNITKVMGALILLAAMLTSVLCFGSCAKTPDEIAAENVVTLDQVDWTLEVTLADGSSSSYSLADANKHTLAKIYAYVPTWMSGSATVPGGMRQQFVTIIAEGIMLSDMLTDLGITEFSSIDYYDASGDKYTLSSEQAHDETCLVGWIRNKTEVFDDLSKNDKTYVGIVSEDSDVMCSLATTKIVVNP